MKSVNPYLNFPGNTEEAFGFYKSVFGCGFAMVARFRDLDPDSGVPEQALERSCTSRSRSAGHDAHGHRRHGIDGTAAERRQQLLHQPGNRKRR